MSSFVTEKSTYIPQSLSWIRWFYDPIENIPSNRIMPVLVIFKCIQLAIVFFNNGNQKLINYCELLRSNIIPYVSQISEISLDPKSYPGYISRFASAIHYLSVTYFNLFYSHSIPIDDSLIKEIKKHIENLEENTSQDNTHQFNFNQMQEILKFLKNYFPFDPEINKVTLVYLQAFIALTFSIVQQSDRFTDPMNRFENLRYRLGEPWGAFDDEKYKTSVPGPQISLQLSALFSGALEEHIPERPSAAVLKPPESINRPLISPRSSSGRLPPRYSYPFLSNNDEYIEFSSNRMELKPLIDVLKNLLSKIEREKKMKLALDSYSKIDIILAFFSVLNLFENCRKSPFIKIPQTIALMVKCLHGIYNK